MLRSQSTATKMQLQLVNVKKHGIHLSYRQNDFQKDFCHHLRLVGGWIRLYLSSNAAPPRNNQSLNTRSCQISIFCLMRSDSVPGWHSSLWFTSVIWAVASRCWCSTRWIWWSELSLSLPWYMIKIQFFSASNAKSLQKLNRGEKAEASQDRVRNSLRRPPVSCYSASFWFYSLLEMLLMLAGWQPDDEAGAQSAPRKYATTGKGALFRAGVSRTPAWNILSLIVAAFCRQTHTVTVHFACLWRRALVCYFK